jgi:stearoyl-CoA desaturase (delta-9 desaturase)
MTYYCLKLMEWLGLVWDVRGVPVYVREQKRKEETIGVPLSAVEG